MQSNFHRLQDIARFCHRELALSGVHVYGDECVPILPVHTGRPSKASELSYVLRKKGVAATPVSKPAVDMWQSRVRISLCAEYTDEEINTLLNAIYEACSEIGVIECERRPRPFCSTATGDPPSRHVPDLHEEHEQAVIYLCELIVRQSRALLCNNQEDYTHPNALSGSVIKAGHKSRALYGIGSGSSRLLLGTFVPHIEVEKLIMDLTQQRAALTYSVGLEGLTSTVAALCRPIKQCKAHYFLVPSQVASSVEDGFRIAPRSARTVKISYRDTHELLGVIESVGGRKGGCHVTLYVNALGHDGAYTNFNDLMTRLAPVRSRLRTLTLLIDDSLGLKLHDRGISGAVDLVALQKKLKATILIYGSFHASLGLNGSYLAGDAAIIQELRWSSRFYVFSSSPPPFEMSMIAAVLKERMALEDS